MNAIYDELVWSYEPPDYDVGITSETWVHEACEAEYDEGCRIESTLSGREVRNGVVYAREKFVLTCIDCGASTTFEGEAMMGFDGEYGV